MKATRNGRELERIRRLEGHHNYEGRVWFLFLFFLLEKYLLDMHQNVARFAPEVDRQVRD